MNVLTSREAKDDMAILEDGHREAPPETPTTPKPLISEEQRLWTALAEPPDIDYRVIIEEDKEKIDRLLEHH